MEICYYYPSCGGKGYSNPYSLKYKEALNKCFDLKDGDNKRWLMACLPLLINSFKADIFILNWIESIIYHKMGILQYFIARLALFIIRIRKKKIVWMFHNIHPHQGSNKFTKSIQDFLFRNATLIISHSKEAADYARNKSQKPVEYRCHPVSQIIVETNENVPYMDVFIWGTILPYKGIAEFLRENEKRRTKLRVMILGKCDDQCLAKEIAKFSGTNVEFQNRRADFKEIASRIKKSRYVLFPYIGDCVSSSGALIDTIAMGGIVCGPDRGAFKDLKEEGLCLTYNSYDDLFESLKANTSIDSRIRYSFIEENSWREFVSFLKDRID